MTKRDTAITSILAYHSVDLKGQKFAVVKAMRDLMPTGKPLTRENISSEANIKETSACARLNELRKEGIVGIGSPVMGAWGKWVETYYLIAKGQNSLI